MIGQRIFMMEKITLPKPNGFVEKLHYNTEKSSEFLSVTIQISTN